MTTAIFYHPSFSRRSYLTRGSRLQDFPRAIEHLLADPAYRMYESPALEEEWILKVHTPGLLEGVKRDPLCVTAWHSAGGVVAAAEKIALGEVTNAFAFIGAGGHHSGRDFFGGYCCFNDVVIAMSKLRELHGLRRFAILDTDAHHGNGTRALTEQDHEVLHVCLCFQDHESADGTKIDVLASGMPHGASVAMDVNALYAETASRAFEPRVRSFRPDMIFWYFGFDTHQGDYGDLGLTIEAYLTIGKTVKALADEVCGGRLEVVLGGGSLSHLARTLIPPIIKLLGEDG